MLSYWYEALAQERGLCLETDKAELLIQRLYQARRQSGDEQLNQLHLRRISDTEVWIVRNTFGKESDGAPGVEAP